MALVFCTEATELTRTSSVARRKQNEKIADMSMELDQYDGILRNWEDRFKAMNKEVVQLRIDVQEPGHIKDAVDEVECSIAVHVPHRDWPE